MLEPIKRIRLYEIVVERILSMMKESSLKPGDQLPTERELSTQLKVSRTSVREGLRALETLGYLESRVGVSGGTFIKAVSQTEMQNSIVHLIETYKKQEYYLQTVEFRIIFESATAKLAARRHDDEDIHRMEAALSQMDSEIAQGQLGLMGESTFHHSVAQATHNELLSRFSDILEDLVSDSRKTTLSLPGLAQESLDDHKLIFDAIRRGSERDAASLMKGHLSKGHDKAKKGELDFDL